MAFIYGDNLSRRDILKRAGNISQIAGIREFRYQHGKADGVYAMDIRTGGGLTYTLIPDRCLDIAFTEYKGIPMSFLSKSAITAPGYYQPFDPVWGAQFFGGMLTTCGLMSTGNVSAYEDRQMPTHGEISNIPARIVAPFERWQEDDLYIGVSATIYHSRMYRENYELRRTIWSKLGESTIHISDEVENLSFKTMPLTLLYHLNFGYPMLSKDAELIVDSIKVTPDCPMPPEDEKHPERYLDPYPSSHHGWYHDVRADDDGMIKAVLQNRKIGIRATVEYNKNQLKNLTQWKFMDENDYVTALEPCNNFLLGTKDEAENGTLEYLKPGETKSFKVSLCFSEIDNKRS
jgi:galactose mutarotase-like enzyme